MKRFHESYERNLTINKCYYCGKFKKHNDLEIFGVEEKQVKICGGCVEKLETMRAERLKGESE